MAKEILLYGPMVGSNITDVITAIDGDEDIVIRVNSNGGSPEDTFGLIAKMNEYGGKMTVKVDGRAHSAAAFLLAYAESAEALDVSEFLIHRAAYGSWFEGSEYFTDEIKGNLERINTSLRKALTAKIDVKRFEALKGVKIKDIFSLENRIDVFLTAKEAKQVGLIDKITKITPQKRAEMEQQFHSIAAEYVPQSENKPDKNKDMTLEEFKAKYPEAYNAIYKAGREAGVEQEQERVGAWVEFIDVDAKAVKEGIEGGKEISRKEIVALSRKEFAASKLDDAEDDGADAEDTDTDEPEEKKTAEAKAEEEKTAAFDEEWKNTLGLNEKN